MGGVETKLFHIIGEAGARGAAAPSSRKTEGNKAGGSTPFSGSADGFRRGDGAATWYGSSSVVSEASSDKVDARVDASSWSSTTRATAGGRSASS